MANTSRINGFRPVKHLNGAPYNGQANLYYVATASDEIYVGDVAKRGSAADSNGIPGADLCGATDQPIGVVVGIMDAGFTPVNKMTTGDLTLGFPYNQRIDASDTGRYILVADSPDLVFEVEAGNGTPAAADIGLNASHANGTRSSSVNVCPAYIDMGTEATTATLNFKLLGFSLKADNEVGANAKMLVSFNVHAYGSVGTVGIA